MADASALIGVDWGTSSFRALLLDGRGAVLDRRSAPHGILSVSPGGFEAALSQQIGGWLETSPVPVIMSGMIGSRQGWLEAPYVTCPAGLSDLAAGLVQVRSLLADIRIVPGVETATATMRDVMRGEETQIFGALALSGAEEGRFVLPGTHSKWATVASGRIVSFATYMTGEIYAACRGHTILGRLMENGVGSPAAFAKGARDGAESGTPGALLHRLFGVRTAGLFGEIAGPDLADYLSGLLIGAELADAGITDAPAQIIAAPDLAQRYRSAMLELGSDPAVLDAEVVAAGQFAIAKAAGLIAGAET